MRSVPLGFLCSAAAFFIAAPALAASDYFLKIDGVDGETKAKVSVRGWDPEKKEDVASDSGSSGQDASAARDTSPKVTASQNTQSLRESRPKISPSQNSQSLREAPASPSKGGTVKLTASQNSQSLREAGRPVGDFDGDGAPDLAALEQANSVNGFSIALPASSEAAQKWCRELHIKSAKLVKADGIVYDLEDATASSCSTTGEETTIAVASGKIRELRGHVTLIK